MKKNEGSKLTKKDKLVIGGGLFLVALVGFKAGQKYEGALITRGLDAVLKVDPTLEEHMINALGKVGYVIAK